jgi:hypothetical protein|tara:strand:- start:1220 stop:1591 length:372 start_codon:yes stop_codon:yes gene_type:complete
MIERARLFLKAYPHFKDAMDLIGHQHSHDDVFVEYMRGDAWLFSSENAAGLMRIEVNPQGKTAEIWLAGGDLNELLTVLLPKIEVWAAKKGCRNVAHAGRNGWLKKMDKHGYQNGGSSMWREI